MTDPFKVRLQQLSRLIKDEINIIENGGKLSSYKRQIKPRQKQLRTQLKEIIKLIASTGEIPSDWVDVRNYIIITIRELLDNYHQECPDCKTFEQEKQVILQYFVFFERPPFTIQRIAEVLSQPKRFYSSTKKILYAFEKLVNVSDPDER